MKTLIRKELRECLPLAVLGLIAFSIFGFGVAHDYGQTLKQVAYGRGGYYGWDWQPLIEEGIFIFSGIFCAALAALLGWSQIRREGHRDLQAFLLHRPVSRTTIFTAKAIAGLSVYLLSAGVPLGSLVWWLVTPGHVAAPFHAPMLLPLAFAFLCGIPFYFAGMITGIRQARWYASRGVAILTACLLVVNNDSPHRFLITVVGMVVLGLAAWGSFKSQGFYEGQSRLGKASLAAVLLPGFALIVFVAVALAYNLVPGLRPSRDQIGSYYLMLRDGNVCQVTEGGGTRPQIVDLDGKPVIDPKTGQMILRQDLNRLMAPGWDFWATTKKVPKDVYRHEFSFTLWRGTPDTLWFYDGSTKRIVGYDVRTRDLIGSLGPDGFTPDSADGATHFENRPDNAGLNFSLRTRWTADAVFVIDTVNRSARTIFTNSNADPVLIAQDGFGEFDSEYQYSIVVTKQWIRLLSMDGATIWQTPYTPSVTNYHNVRVYRLTPTNQYALWFYPPKKTLPEHLTWLDTDKGTVKTMDLPSIIRAEHKDTWLERSASLLVPSTFWAIIPLIEGRGWPGSIEQRLLWGSLLAGLIIWAPLGWWLGRRHHLAFKHQLGWALFEVAFGLPGFLTYIAVHEWPVQETCPNCRKRRNVDREHCEHCGAPFAPAEKTGTEIFEPLTVS